MYFLFLLAKVCKYIALASLIMTFFSDLLIFKVLCLLIFVEIFMNISEIKCSILQIVGMFKVNSKFKDNRPSVENYVNKVEYMLPFEGKWAVVNGSFERFYSHSWDVPTQRYAYDFVILDKNGKSHEGEFDKCESYNCYGKKVLAPADGIVVEMANNAKDSLFLPKGLFISRSKHIAGNYIVIKHDENEYSTLAHLQKDSICVKVGDEVEQGQFIARCGNTGNSSEPHLHFQVQTGQSFYNSVGLPIKFKSIRIFRIENYSNMDERPHLDPNEIPKGYISRGYGVENSL